jgi:hypothetical protein
MSKGDSPRPGKKKPLPTPKPQTKPTGGGGGGASPPLDLQCWDFPLVLPTPGAKQAKQGMPVVGVPQGAKIIIQGSPGTLGYAPNAVAKKMIAAMGRGEHRLQGQVISDNEPEGGIRVQLCIA